MTAAGANGSTVNQSGKAAAANGKGRLRGDGAGGGDDLKAGRGIPILSDKVVNVASVPQRSPLRYPGGKTWLVPEIRKFLQGLDFRPEVFVEPFAGGGIASLTAVMDDYVDRAVLCEKDPDVSNLWRCMLADAEALARRVERFAATPENVRAVIADAGVSGMDAAFRTLLWNRISRGGVMARGASVIKQGENGKGIASRWYADTLAARIRTIGRHAARLSFFEGDGVGLVALCRDSSSAAFFIDPPYTAAGKRAGRRLYTYNEIDHEVLFERMSEVRGVFMMTYDESPDVIEMARRQGFHLAKVPMKSTHHAVMYELLISSHELAP
ncbi:MAG: DNA adenine methylase [Caldilineaceae bacterium]|nr:DNA adenine methylase [Caldilineaceae bacterium]